MDSDFETSMFSGDIATLIRIDFLITMLHKLNITQQVRGHDLTPAIEKTMIQLYIELYPHLKDKAKKNETKSEVDQGNEYLKWFKSHPIIRTPKHIKMNKEFTTKLFEFHLWIMKELKEKGLLMRKGLDPNDAL